MRRHRMALVGVSALFAAAVAWAGQGPADDEKALDAYVKAWETACNAHDAKALAALYTEDAESVMPDGQRVEGRAAIEKSFAESFDKNPKVKTKLTVISRQFIKSDVAIEDGLQENSGADRDIISGQESLYVGRRQAGWKVAGGRGPLICTGR